MEVEILHNNSKKTFTKLHNLHSSSTILDVKNVIHREKSKYYPERQAIKSDPNGKPLKDEDTLRSVGLTTGGQLYFKDLGPQIGWKTVFLTEYAGPLSVYMMIYSRPAILYGAEAAAMPRPLVVQLAAACWTGHYIKRLLETLFVHRFSHATMPMFNLFKNCGYYWGFAAYVSYFVNHPFYTPPYFGNVQIYVGLAAFLLCEFGNFSIHWALRNLRPPGTKVRRIPVPTSNPFTQLFRFVSCPNYTYEVGAWCAFTFMTQVLPAGIFALVGFYQMALWALGKHTGYKKEFNKYPRTRKAIVPFLL